MKPDKKTEFIVPQEDEVPPELQKAESLRLAGEPDEAMRIANTYLNDHIGDVGGITIAALCLFDAGRIGMAQALFKQAVALKPEMSGLWNNLGLCYQEGSDLEEGEACFIKALHRDPNNALAYNNLAQLYVNTARPEKAMNCAAKALAIDPGLPDAHYNNGLDLLQMGKWKDGWLGYEHNLGVHRARKERIYGKERLLGAIENLVRRGRARGLGVTLVTQRSAVLNKNVLSQADLLVAMRTVAPQDRAAIDAWVKANGDEVGRKQVMDSLASLAIGEAWCWSPGWLGTLTRVKINRRETFDSSATPKMGVRVREPKKLSTVDLARIKDQMASTIAQAKQEDPRELRARIADLERVIRLDKSMQVVKENVVKTVEKKVPWLNKRAIREIQDMAMRARLLTKSVYELKESLDVGMRELVLKLERAADRVEAPIRQAMGSLKRNSFSVGSHTIPEKDRAAHVVVSGPGVKRIAKATHSGREVPVESQTSAVLLAGERRMVGVLKAYSPRLLTKIQMCTLAGLSPSSGTTSNYVRKLVRLGVIKERGDKFELLNENAASEDVDVSRAGFRSLWNKQLLAGERRILDLITQHVHMSRDELLEAAGLTNSGTVNNYFRRLRRCGLIEIEAGQVRQSNDLKELMG